MSLPDSAKSDLRRVAGIAALAAYVGITASLYQNEARMRATGESLARRHRAIESKFLDVSSHLDFLEKAGNAQPSLAGRLREQRDQVTEERRESTREYEAWKEQSSAWGIKRWFVLAFATLSFLPVVLWGFQSWGIWARDRRLNRSMDQ